VGGLAGARRAAAPSGEGRGGRGRHAHLKFASTPGPRRLDRRGMGAVCLTSRRLASPGVRGGHRSGRVEGGSAGREGRCHDCSIRTRGRLPDRASRRGGGRVPGKVHFSRGTGHRTEATPHVLVRSPGKECVRWKRLDRREGRMVRAPGRTRQRGGNVRGAGLAALRWAGSLARRCRADLHVRAALHRPRSICDSQNTPPETGTRLCHRCLPPRVPLFPSGLFGPPSWGAPSSPCPPAP